MTEEGIQQFTRWLEDWGYAQNPRIRDRKNLAERVGVSYSTLRGWAKNARPRLPQLALVAKATGRDLRELAEMVGYSPEEADRAAVFLESSYERKRRKIMAYDKIPLADREELVRLLDADEEELQAAHRGGEHHNTPLYAN